MSYDLGLYYDKQPATVKTFAEGGTYVLGGSNHAELNITWNYAHFYYEHLNKEEGLRWLYGKTGLTTSVVLAYAVDKLGTDRDGDYWASTPGNAGYALSILLGWAAEHPDAVWDGD